jgi:uncharacterized membrane protein YtjA (UPF0391 family)
MLGWTIFFFLVAVFNAIVGFTGIAAMSSGMAIFAFFVFLGVSITTLIMHIKDVRRRSRER